MEGCEMIARRIEAVRLISLRITAQRREVERSVIEQVLQLTGQLRTVLATLRRGHPPQIEIVERFRVLPRVTRFQKVEDGILRCVPAQRILGFRNRRLRAQKTARQDGS